jgi:hypothetical protein
MKAEIIKDLKDNTSTEAGTQHLEKGRRQFDKNRPNPVFLVNHH